MSKLLVVNRDGHIVEFDMANHGLIMRIGIEVRQLLIIEASGAVAFRCVPSDPAWSVNVGIVSEWLIKYGVRS